MSSKTSDPRHARLSADQGSAFNAEDYEESNVHSVYESIASHFSETRYKPWPLIPAFLNSLPVGSIGADLGCGNGKYLSLRNVLVGTSTKEQRQSGIIEGNDILTVGLDRSSNLVNLATSNIVVGERVLIGGGDDTTTSKSSSRMRRRNEVLVGDAISSSYRSRSVDYALSIATIHHFSTRQRRVLAVQELIRITRPASSSPSPSSSSSQRVDDQYPAIAQNKSGRFLIYVWALEQRGESRRKFESIEKAEDESGRDLLVPWVQKGQRQSQATADNKPDDKVYQRFYHVFEQGELETLVEEAASQMPHVVVRHETSGWERGNWYGIWQCIEGV